MSRRVSIPIRPSGMPRETGRSCDSDEDAPVRKSRGYISAPGSSSSSFACPGPFLWWTEPVQYTRRLQKSLCTLSISPDPSGHLFRDPREVEGCCHSRSVDRVFAPRQGWGACVGGFSGAWMRPRRRRIVLPRVSRWRRDLFFIFVEQQTT